METTILLYLGFGTFFGGALAAVCFWLVWRRMEWRHKSEVQERLSAAELAGQSEMEDIRGRMEIEFGKRRLESENELNDLRLTLRSREEELNSLLNTAEKERENAERRREELQIRLKEVEELEERLHRQQSDYRRRLQEVGQFSVETARKQLLDEVRLDCADEVRAVKSEVLQRSEKEISAEARRILIDSMQRLSSEPQQDITATIVHIPGDEMKGRLIGREGRNIKSFESMTGTTLLIDETPDSVLISSFDPVRREIARIALEALIKDGRIHPGSIEEAVRRADDEVQQSVLASGEDALRRLKLSRVHPEVLVHLGRMRFRLSYNQNSLDHSIEVANLCALMAAELGLNTTVAKRAGLFHDIGKVLDQDHEGSHAVAGSFFLKRYGEEDPFVINAVAGHHGEVPAESPYVALVMMADSLSAMRPGARSDSVDGYIQRVRNLEGIAKGIEGVTDAFAIQAGREIRVIVMPDKVSEEDAPMIARKIRRRIEDELQYPGTIKITVIREQRFSEVAK